MVDKYYEAFKNIKEKHKVKKKKAFSRSGGGALHTFHVKRARDFILKQRERPLLPKEKRSAMRIIRRMMNATRKEFGKSQEYYILLGAEYAEKLGEGNSKYVKRKLLQAYGKAPENFDRVRVEDFFRRNHSTKKAIPNLFSKINNLKLFSFIYLVSGAFFLVLRFLGKYPANQEIDFFFLFGILLIVLGTLGFIASSKKKKY